jgi:hypothetical protein
MRNVVVLVVVIIVAIIAIWAVSAGGGLGSQQHSLTIVNGTFSVGALTYSSQEFSVPSGASSASVSGSFTASGGSGNDIEVYIMDSTAYINWQNGHSVSIIYDSGRLTTANFNIPLAAGTTYYIVYSNQFSILSSKNVYSAVRLTYTG